MTGFNRGKGRAIAMIMAYALIMMPFGACSANKTQAGATKSTSKFAAIIEVVTGIVGALVVTGCGSSSSSTASTTVTGSVVLGPVSNMQGKLVDIVTGEVMLSGIKTAADGTFSYTPPALNAAHAYEVVFTPSQDLSAPSTYTDEATGSVVNITQDDPTYTIGALFSKEESAAGKVALTAFSDEALHRVREKLADANTTWTADAIADMGNAALQEVASVHGFPAEAWKDLRVPPANVALGETPNPASIYVAQYSQFMKDSGLAPGAGAYAAMRDDFKDGDIGDATGKYAVLAVKWDKFDDAADNYKANGNCPPALAQFYQADPTKFVGAPDSTPAAITGAFYNDFKTVAAGGVSPCVTDPTSVACPTSPAFKANPEAGLAHYDQFATTTGGGYRGDSGYIGDPNGKYFGNGYIDGGTGSYKGTDGGYTGPPPTTEYVPGVAPTNTFVALMGEFVQTSAGVGTITIKNSGTMTAVTGTYTWKLTKYVPGSGMTEVSTGTITNGSTLSVNLTSQAAGSYMYEIKDANNNMAHASVYRE